MEESAIKGLTLLELNDSGADSQTPSTSTAISVEGYDTSLKEYPLRLALQKHFTSCGNITQIYVPRDFKKKLLKSVAFMWIKGDEKALQLSGTDVGGWTAIVKAAPWQKEIMYDSWCPAATPEATKTHLVQVTGYDTSLPEINIQMALCKHFSSCGEISQVAVLSSGIAFLYLKGERCVDKALELSGRNMGGLTLVVQPLVPRGPRPENLKNLKRGRVRHCTTTGYMPPGILLEQAKKKKTEKKTEKEKEKEKMTRREKEKMTRRDKENNMKMKMKMKEMEMKIKIK